MILIYIIMLLFGIYLIVVAMLDFFVEKTPFKLGWFHDIMFLLVGTLYISVSLCYFLE